MLNVNADNIHLQCNAKNKDEVLALIAKTFKEKGFVSGDCEKDLHQREKEISTFLGNGIVLPHLPIASRDKVINSGIEIFQFPEGVIWDRTNVMFIAIAVAPKEKEHITVLKEIASIFEDEVVANLLSLLTDKDEFIKYLNK